MTAPVLLQCISIYIFSNVSYFIQWNLCLVSVVRIAATDAELLKVYRKHSGCKLATLFTNSLSSLESFSTGYEAK